MEVSKPLHKGQAKDSLPVLFRMGRQRRFSMTWAIGILLRRKDSSWEEKRRVTSVPFEDLSCAVAGLASWIRAYGSWVRQYR